jgi:hypothetical protein
MADFVPSTGMPRNNVTSLFCAIHIIDINKDTITIDSLFIDNYLYALQPPKSKSQKEAWH